jgi:hypothetical protein
MSKLHYDQLSLETANAFISGSSDSLQSRPRAAEMSLNHSRLIAATAQGALVSIDH